MRKRAFFIIIISCGLMVFCFSQKTINPTTRKEYPKVKETTINRAQSSSKSKQQKRIIADEDNVTIEQAKTYTPSYETKSRDYELLKKYNRLIQLFTLLKHQMDSTVSDLFYYKAQSANKIETEKTQKEVAYWKNKADILTAQYVKPTDNVMKIKLVDSKIEFKVVDIIGDPKEQTVTITFVITNNKAHQIVRINNPYDGKVRSVAYDNYGNTYYVKSVQIGDKQEQDFIQDLLLTGVPRRGYIVLRNVLPSVDRFKYILINWRNYNYDGGENEKKGQLEIKNAKINWKK